VLRAKLKQTINSTGIEWVAWAESVPVAVMLKSYVFSTSLLAVIVNAVPEALGVSFVGEAVHSQLQFLPVGAVAQLYR
jgi:hypothetical protein